jgi:hypothetical protein
MPALDGVLASGASTTSARLSGRCSNARRRSSPRSGRWRSPDRLTLRRRTISGGSYSRVRTWYSLIPRESRIARSTPSTDGVHSLPAVAQLVSSPRKISARCERPFDSARIFVG